MSVLKKSIITTLSIGAIGYGIMYATTNTGHDLIAKLPKERQHSAKQILESNNTGIIVKDMINDSINKNIYK